MNAATFNLRVSKILSHRLNGYIFTAVLIDCETGAVSNSTNYAVVKVSAKIVAGRLLKIGMWVEVSGVATKENRIHEGFRQQQINIAAENIVFVRPSGEHLIRFLSDSVGFKGIGIVRARQLWDKFGDSVYEILDQGDVEKLSVSLPESIAVGLVAAWAEIGNSETIRWLYECNFGIALIRKVVRYFGSDTKQKLEEDPYRLLSFSASWKEVDSFARSKLRVALNDPRRLMGACEEALYRSCSAGNTILTSKMIRAYLGRLLVSIDKFELDRFIDASLTYGQSNGGYIVTADGLFQSLGIAVLERTIAQAFAFRIAREPLRLLSTASLATLLECYEAREGVLLTTDQMRAVEAVNDNHLVCISGSASVGKITVLKAVLAVVQSAGAPVRLIALSGNAAKRISEATGISAQTIASFIKNVVADDLANGVLIIVEASMVDLLSMERIVSMIPNSCRIVLVGDSAQLWPVAPGLVFHEMTADHRISNVELKSENRFGHEIARVAIAIRDGDWVHLGNDVNQPIAFLDESDVTRLAGKILDLYEGIDTGTQILCTTRSGGAGSIRLNQEIQARFNPLGEPLMVVDDRHDQRAYTGYRLNDTVLCTRNFYEFELRNGSLGRIVEIPDQPTSFFDSNGDCIGMVVAWIVWDDGVRRPLLTEMLNHLELGYAITVHRAHGFKWRRVLLAIVPSKSLDRIMLYTAVTRAQSQALMVGPLLVAADAVRGRPHSNRRVTGLQHALLRELSLEQ